MKKYKILISLIVTLTLFVSTLPGSIAFAETTLVEDAGGKVIEVDVAPETGDTIIIDDGEENEAEAGEESGEESKEEITQEETNKFPAAKLSGVDFVHVYDGSFETVSGYLRKLGVFKDTDTDPELVLTRGEFAVFVARIINAAGGGVQPSFRYEFKDVEEGTSYYDAVNTLCNYGFVEGDGNGYFYPDNEIKSAEAVIILMNMLGYYEIAHLRGSGDSGYRNLALNMKFTKEVPFNYTTTVTLEKAARLIYHALHERVAESTSYSSNNVTFSQSEDTLMHRYLGVYTVEGIVTANEFTSLHSKDGKTSENTIKINNTILCFDDVAFNPQDYLGLYARVYYKNEIGKNAAIFIEAISEKYELLKINAKNIESFNKTTNTVTYKDGKKVKQEKVGMDIKIIFNSVAVEGNIHENYFTPDVGQLVFIDNNRDNKFDVLIIDSYSTYVAKAKLSNEEGTLHDELGVHDPLSLADKNVRVYMNNEKADYTAISTGDVVFVATEKVKYAETAGLNNIAYQTIDHSSEYVKLLASNSKISGTIDSYSDEYVYIDSAEYEYSNGFYVAADIGASSKAINSNRLGAKVSGRLDLNGDIAWLSKITDENVKYAFVVKAGVGAKRTDNHRIMMFTQDAELRIFEFDDKVNVYKKWLDSDPINTTTYYAKSYAGNTITSELANIGDRGLVKYKLTEDGKVKDIHIAADDTANDYVYDIPVLQEGVFYKSAKVTRADNFDFNGNGLISPTYYYAKSTTIGFKVPSENAPEFVQEDSRYYKVYSGSAMYSHASKVTATLYDVNNTLIGAVLHVTTEYDNLNSDNSGTNTGNEITYETNTDNYDSVVIDSIRQVRNEDDVFVTELTAWCAGKLKKYKFANAELVSNYVRNENKDPKPGYQFEHSAKSPSILKRGDVVLLRLNSLGFVSGFRIAHRATTMLDAASEEAPFGYEYYFSGAEKPIDESIFIGSSSFVAGTVVKKSGSSPIIRTVSGAPLRRLPIYSSSAQIIVYDMQEDKMTVAVNSSKIPTFADCEEGDYIFWCGKERATLVALIVKNYR